ncbi:MAG: type II secretion system protein GspL [Pseudomonadota bacterium]
MSDIIYAGVRDTDLRSVTWVRASTDGEVLSEPGRGTLEQLASAAGATPVSIVFCSSDLSGVETDLPVSGKKLLNALPYALEEQFPGEVDELHFAVGDKREDGRRQVNVVPQRSLQELLDACQDAGIQPRAIYAVQDALDAPDGHLHVLLVDDVTIVDGAGVAPVTFKGLPVELAVTAALDSAQYEELEIRQITIYADAKARERHGAQLEVSEISETPVEIRELSQGWFGFAARALLARPGVDLRQGTFGVKSDTLALLRPWYAAAALLVAVGFVAFAGTALEARALSQRSAALDEQILDRLQRIDGQRVDAPQAAALLSRVLGRRSPGTSSQSSSDSTADGVRFLDMLGALATARGSNALDIEAISFDNGTLNLQVVTESDVALENLKDAIAENNGLEARILRTERKDDNAVSGRLQVQGGDE